MRFLCISDIHGDADALAAVLATAERRGWSRLLVAGDLCFPGEGALETWRKLMGANALIVQGVSDRALATIDPDKLAAKTDHERARVERLRAVQNELGEIIQARLAKLPTQVRLPLEDGSELLLVHGSPADPSEPFSHEMTDEELSALVGDDPADLVVCGGSHVPFDRKVGDVRIVNVGSVGDAPGGDHAHATFIETRTSGVDVVQLVVPLRREARASGDASR